MSTNCSGECCICAFGGCCLAGRGDDDFLAATNEQISERLKNGSYPNYRQMTIDELARRGDGLAHKAEGGGREVNFTFGRDNLALTVFVPFDCTNNCRFCMSKETYITHKPSMDNVKYQMERFFKKYNYPIKDVVFTGGEPMADIDGLQELIDLVPAKYNIYINTTYTKRNLQRFVDLLNGCDKIKGVNISRHYETYEQDCALLCDIATDEQISMIKKPVRINCVVDNQDISKVIARWKGTEARLFFRKNFNIEQDFTELHNPYDEVALKLVTIGFRFKSHTQCNVCDTTIFEKEDQIVAYHKGCKNSSIITGKCVEINDLIIDQTGFFTFDWGATNLEIISKLEEKAQKKYLPEPFPFVTPLYHGRTYCGGYSRGCGSGGC